MHLTNRTLRLGVALRCGEPKQPPRLGKVLRPTLACVSGLATASGAALQHTDRGLRHSTCSGGRQHVGRRSFCAALFGGGYRIRRRGQRRLRGAQQGLGWTIVGLLLPFVRFLLCQKRTQQVCGARPFLPTHLVAPQSHSSVLVAVKGPSTSYTFRLFSL